MNLEKIESDFERDWAESEVQTFITENGSVLRALDELRISKPEIDAIEHRAVSQRIPFKEAVRSTLQRGLQYA